MAKHHYPSKTWTHATCYRDGCDHPVYVDKAGVRWSYCEFHLKRAGVSDFRKRLLDPQNREHDSW